MPALSAAMAGSFQFLICPVKILPITSGLKLIGFEMPPTL